MNKLAVAVSEEAPSHVSTCRSLYLVSAGKDPAPLCLFSNVIFVLYSFQLDPCSCQ